MGHREIQLMVRGHTACESGRKGQLEFEPGSVASLRGRAADEGALLLSHTNPNKGFIQILCFLSKFLNH